MTVVQDGFVQSDPAEEVARSSQHPHGLKTTTTVMNSWDLVKVEGDVFSIDIPSLSAAANHAFLRHPVRLVIDLTVVDVCLEEGIRWLREMSQRVGRCGGNLVVAVAPGTPLQEALESEGIATFDGNQLARLLSDVPTDRGT